MRPMVKNMTNSRGNRVANQFEVRTKDGHYFQSYDTVIVKVPSGPGKIQLDKNSWNYSRTTGKYRNMFLGESIAETREKIKSEVYELTDLN